MQTEADHSYNNVRWKETMEWKCATNRVNEVFLHIASTQSRMFSPVSFSNNFCLDLRLKEMIMSLIPC